jgi:AcrR family transcriptional regulator
VAEGTIYRHFRSKQHLLNELYRAAARWATKLVAETEMHVGAREKLNELGRGLAAGAAREPAITRLFFIQRHGGLLDDESHKTARDFRLALEAVIAQGKAEGSVKPGAAELWAAVWLSVVSMMMDRVAAREWTAEHAGVAQTIEAAWDAIRGG